MGRLRAEAREGGAGDGSTCGDCAESDGARSGDGGDGGDGEGGEGGGGGGDTGSGGGGGKEGGGGQRGPGVAMAARLGATLAASEWDKDEVRALVMHGALRSRGDAGGRCWPLPRSAERRR